MRSLVVIALALGAACANKLEGDPSTRPDAVEAADAYVDDTGDAAAPGDAPEMWVVGGTLEQRTCPPETFLSFQNFGSGFMSEYCVGCHSSQIPANMRQGAPEGVDFDSLDKVRSHAAAIYLRAGDDYATMPPAGGPDRDGRILLGEWLACGAPL